MFIQMKTFVLKAGHSGDIAARFSGESAVEKMKGFVDLSVLVKRSRKDEEEVIVMIRWESEEDWMAWEKSDIHLAGHRESRGKPKPDYILSVVQSTYDVKAKRVFAG